LSEHSFSLHTDTHNAVNNYQSTISDTESSCDFGRKKNVPGESIRLIKYLFPSLSPLYDLSDSTVIS
jgi:hypothetical protein